MPNIHLYLSSSPLYKQFLEHQPGKMCCYFRF